MIVLSRDDENLQGLLGRALPSEITPGVTYRPEQTLGKGGGSVAFLARRLAPEGEAPVVV